MIENNRNAYLRVNRYNYDLNETVAVVLFNCGEIG